MLNDAISKKFLLFHVLFITCINIWANSNDYIFRISPEPVDSQATAEAKQLYTFLKYQFGHRIITGQTLDHYDAVKILSGKSPMVQAGDFQHFTEGYAYLWKNGGHTFGKHDDGSVDALIEWYNQSDGKGIVSYQWHWHSPSGGEPGTNTFYTTETSFDITKAVTPGTQEYQDIIRDIDDIAAELKRFQDEGIPVLWRPLHEAGGGWFWWGAKGPEPCLELYNILFNRLKNHHQLHNLIWVWSTPEPEWFPGNDKVDIIGHDSYPGSYNYESQQAAFDALYNLTNGEKLIAMTENGPIPNPGESLKSAPWLFFMSWSDLVEKQNSKTHIQQVYNHPDVLSIESTNVKTSLDWRSSLYPESWKPGYKDSLGRFLHDFSHAGYHQGEKPIPVIGKNIVNIAKAPYNGDITGETDVTSVIQQALDDVGEAGGGVVYLPAGTYKINPGTHDYGLRIKYDSTILRGAGPDSTFIYNEATFMRYKNLILIQGPNAEWSDESGSVSDIRHDLLHPTRIIPVKSVSGFEPGDHIVLRTDGTSEFIAEHKMAGIWTNWATRVMFVRTIDSIDTRSNLVYIDSPTRYYMKTRDNARIYHAKTHVTECGIENLSIGNLENPKDGWDEETYKTSGTGAYEVHASHVIEFKHGYNSWVKNVHTFKPSQNIQDVHVLSNCLILNQCRNITVDSCFFQKPQYEGGGGNGYMYILQSNDCLVKNSRANHSRHNYDFKFPYSNGNVIHNCIGENSKYSSDFHMYLSMSNLIDNFTVDGDYLESVFRPYGGSVIHGYSSTQSVFYNTYGQKYHEASWRDYIIESRQFGWGYVIGTSGPASNIRLDPVEGQVNGYDYNTEPRDFAEGIGNGENLRPVSLYLDQLDKRLKATTHFPLYDVKINLINARTNTAIENATVTIFDEAKETDGAGLVYFNDMLSSFHLSAEHENFMPIQTSHVVIWSDTTLTIPLVEKTYTVNIKVVDESINKPFNGIQVDFANQSKNADEEGVSSFTVTKGNYMYNISKKNYEDQVASLSITSDTTVMVYMNRTHADIRFRLSDGENAIEDAVVKLNNDSLLTNSIGYAGFSQLPVEQSYDYRVKKEGYVLISGDLYLKTDTTLQFTLSMVSTDLMSNKNEIFSIWPVPVKNVLYIKGLNEVQTMHVEVFNDLGMKLMDQTVNARDSQIDVSHLKKGVYVLKAISSGGFFHSMKFIIL